MTGQTSFGPGSGHFHNTLLDKLIRALHLDPARQSTEGDGEADKFVEQRPDWTKAVNGVQETQWAQFLQVDKRPLTVLFLLVVGSFLWLGVVQNLHHSDGASEHANAPPNGPVPGLAAGEPTPQPFTAQSSNRLYSARGYGTAGGTGYGAQFGAPNSPYPNAPLIPGYAQPAPYVTAQDPYLTPHGGYFNPRNAQPVSAVGYSSFPTKGESRYAPLPNGRARLCVSR